MAIQTLNTIKKWFKTGLKPTQTQFWDTWDSFRHKGEKVPVGDIEGVDELLSEVILQIPNVNGNPNRLTKIELNSNNKLNLVESNIIDTGSKVTINAVTEIDSQTEGESGLKFSNLKNESKTLSEIVFNQDVNPSAGFDGTAYFPWGNIVKKVNLDKTITDYYTFPEECFVQAKIIVSPNNGDLFLIYFDGVSTYNLVKFNESGILSVLKSSILGYSYLANDKNDNIYVQEQSSHKILRINTTNLHEKQYYTGNLPLSLLGFDLESNGYFFNYETRNLIYKLDPDGVVSNFTTLNFQIRTGCVKDDGSLYITAYDEDDKNIYSIDNLGTTINVFATLSYKVYEPTIAANGFLYVHNNNYDNGLVYKISPTGQVSLLGAAGNSPRYMAVTRLGVVYISNSASYNLIKISSEKEERLLTLDENGNVVLSDKDVVSINDFKTINGQSIIGNGALIIDNENLQVNSDWNATSGLEQIFNKPDIGALAATVYVDTQDSVLQNQINNKQNNLVSGVNIKTINGTALLGSGNLTIAAGAPLSGTPNYLPKFNSAGNNITDSNAISNNNELVIQGSSGKSGLRFSNMLSVDKFAETKIDLSKYFIDLSPNSGMDNKGNSYFQDFRTRQIIKIAPDKTVTIIAFPPLIHITSWCPDSLGNIYLIAVDFNLYKIDTNGILTAPVYDKTTLTQVFKLGIDSANNIYLGQTSGSSIYKLNTSLELSLYTTLPKTFNSNLTHNFLFDSLGNLYTDVGYSDASFYKISPTGEILYTVFGSNIPSGILFFFIDKDTIYTMNALYQSNSNFAINKVSSTGTVTLVGTTGTDNGAYLNSAALFEGNIYYTRGNGMNLNKFDITLGISNVVLSFPQANGVFTLNQKGVFNILYGSGNLIVLDKLNRGNRTTGNGEVIMDDFYKSDRLILDTPLQINNTININSLKNSSNYFYDKISEWDLGTIIDIVEDSAGNIYNLIGNSIYKINYKGESTLFATVGSTPTLMIINNDTFYTANSGNNTVSKVTIEGVVSTFATAVASVKNMLFDSLGNLIIHTQVSASALLKITPAGVKTTIANLPFGHYNYLTIDSSDNLYTTQFSSGNVYKTTMAGVATRLGTTNGLVITETVNSNIRIVNNIGTTYMIDTTTGTATDQGYYLPYVLLNNTPITYKNGSYYYVMGNALRKLDVTTKLVTTLLIAPTAIVKYKVASNGALWIASGTKMQKYSRPYSKLLTTTETGNITQITEEISQSWIKNNKILENIPVYENNTSAKAILPNNHLYRTSTGVLMITF